MAQSLRNPLTAKRPFAGRRDEAHEEREPADWWANIGLNHVDPETGEETFLSVGQGVPSNLFRPTSGSGEIAEAKNALLMEIMDVAMALEPGQTEVLNLQVQIRRVGQPTGQISETNKFITTLRALRAR